MPGRTLKNYEIYKAKLMVFAKLLRVRVVYIDRGVEGSWSVANRRINIDEGLDESTEIATLLHELGHCLHDAFTNSSPRTQNAINTAYSDFYNEMHRKYQKDIVLKSEKMAWDNGRMIANVLSIRLGKWYDREEEVCLRDYRKD